ncbi:long-chain fatty acid--CoA ligase [Atopobacter sp. AH10]|uniref:AMP-binding protein n=1 Tax=Atopobacter sp. AH10 TaxID=2315861 RepID=UPI000EF178D6|nr:AMP-binding protein [Atopobacter sp. AH10]RLK62677.1 long-chain fatty acid--CoA ligase [Atopobacter sp. AH10]
MGAKEDFLNVDNKDYKDVVDRLIVNILTTKVKIVEDDGLYEKYSEKAWEKVLERFRQCGGESFSDFKKIFHISSEYKRYWGYSPEIIREIYHRFYQHISSSEFIKQLKTNVIQHPQKIAVFSDDKDLTYDELDKLSDKLASALLKFKSDYVVVNYPHRYEMIPIVYGILKAGKVYVPVDHTAPEKEIEVIREKFPHSIYLSDRESDLDVRKVFADEDELIDYRENKLAYIIHTSGTTGKPKGVCATRKNLNYIMKACQSFAPVEEGDCYLFSTRNTFDVSITELFGFLYHAGSVYVYSVKNKNFYKELPGLIQRFSITHVALSPTVLGLLLKYNHQKGLDQIDRLKYLMIAGEEFKYELLRLVHEKLNKVQVINVYGPTETSVYASYFNTKDMTEAEHLNKKVPIGKALPGVQLKIVNDELLIGGLGVTDGYYKDLSQTREKFTAIDGELFYHTGDVVGKNNDVFIYKARRDHQIQLFGIRLELGEVRSTIASIINDPSRDIEVIFENNMLMLFYTGEKIAHLREKLEKEMVSYKVPTKLTHVAEFPLTSSGKIDKKALLEKVFVREKSQTKVNKLEETVLAVVETIMQQKVTLDDNLLDMGLNSLNSIELVLELEERLGLNLDHLNVYVNSSVRKIVGFMEDLEEIRDRGFDSGLSHKVRLKNIPLMRKIEYTYPSFFYARIYHTLNFDSQLIGRIYLEKNQMTYEEIIHKLSKIEAFRSVLSKDLDHFEVLDTPINISKVEVDDARIDLSEQLSQLVKESKDNRGLLYKFAFLESEQEAVLHYAIDHSIADLASLDVLERYILGLIPRTTNYSSYIKEVYAQNKLADVKKDLGKFSGQDDKQVAEILTHLEDKTTVVSLNYLRADTKQVYTEILLYLRQHFLKLYQLDHVKVNLIYNIRRFKDQLDFTSTIGDLHLGLSFKLNREGNIEEELDHLIHYYKEKMFNPKAIGYKHFPRMNADEKAIVECFDESVYISVDFLGVLSRQEFKQVQEKSSETRNEINKLNGRKMNISAYIVDNQLKLILSKQISGE